MKTDREFTAEEQRTPSSAEDRLNWISGKRIGLLVNFKVTHLKDGIKRMVNNL